MKIVIMSDSHLKNETVLSIIEKHPDATCFIHCGDVGCEIQLPEDKSVYLVKGNNDFLDLPWDQEVMINNTKIFITHGHRYHVDISLDELKKQAEENHYQIVCYGHTHDPKWQQSGGCYFINPGSVSFPRGGRIFVPTYCIFEDGIIHYYHAKTHECVDHLFEPKKKVSFWKRLFKKQ